MAKTINMEPLEELFTILTPEELAKKIDSVIFRDGYYILRDNSYCGHENSEEAQELYWLRELRDRLMQVWEQQNANR
ncbi:MAG: hypothetical protein JST21_13085 [Bacteroidetes bacterium]|nr:hypothetical protein [Bacteroidota bacterium]